MEIKKINDIAIVYSNEIVLSDVQTAMDLVMA